MTILVFIESGQNIFLIYSVSSFSLYHQEKKIKHIQKKGLFNSIMGTNLLKVWLKEPQNKQEKKRAFLAPKASHKAQSSHYQYLK